MDIVERIVQFFKKPEKETVNDAPEGVCNLCWGYQEYDGKIRQLYKDKQVDVNNHKDSYMLVQCFVKKHMDGYHVKDGVVHVCPNCAVLNEDTEHVKKYDSSEIADI